MPLDRKSAHGYSHQGATIPLRTAEGLEQWITHGRRPDAFLQAVLCNDLRETMGWADAENRAALHAIVVFLYTEAPAACWGSREKARAWREHRQTANRIEPEQETTAGNDEATIYQGGDPHENSIEAPASGLLSNLPHDA